MVTNNCCQEPVAIITAITTISITATIPTPSPSIFSQGGYCVHVASAYSGRVCLLQHLSQVRGQALPARKTRMKKARKSKRMGASEAPSVDSQERREAARIRRTREMETMYGIRMTDDEWVGEHCSQRIPGFPPRNR